MIIPNTLTTPLNYHVNEINDVFHLSDTNIRLLFELRKHSAKKIAQKSKIII